VRSRAAETRKQREVVMGRLSRLWIVLVATLVAFGPSASAATYTVTDLGTLGGSRSYAAAINARGDIVGWSTLPGDTARHAFLYQSRSHRFVDLDPRGADASSSASAINHRGRIAGGIDVVGGQGASHAALFVRGRIIDLGTPLGYPSAFAVAINHAGDTLIEAGVGFASVAGFLLHHGRTVALPITSAWGLNDRRQVVGSVGPPPNVQRASWSIAMAWQAPCQGSTPNSRASPPRSTRAEMSRAATR
jgi:probable HAF family extracellular repeat protein